MTNDTLDFNLLYRFNNTLDVKVGDILISNPMNVSGLFYKSVILITAHDEFGTTGYILNKQTNINYLTLYENVVCKNLKINYGGPVNLNTSYVLYFSDTMFENSHKILNDFYYSTDVNIINTVCDLTYKVCLGCSVWGPEQLQQEMLNDDWVVYSNMNIVNVFLIDVNIMWSKLLLQIHNRYKIFVNYPINPALN